MHADHGQVHNLVIRCMACGRPRNIATEMDGLLHSEKTTPPLCCPLNKAGTRAARLHSVGAIFLLILS